VTSPPPDDGAAARTTIVVPNWNSGPFLRLCLASVLRLTPSPRVVVVDNRSTDASRRTAEDAARQGLVRLVTREDARNDGAADHGAALDAGLAAVETPLLFTLDSDAWVRRSGWLEPFVSALEAAGAASAGATKFPGGAAQRLWAWVRGRRPGPEASYIRPCHGLYRVEVLRREGLSFAPWRGPDGRARTVGERLHEELVARGQPVAVLPHRVVEAHVGHLRHTTFVLNPERFPGLRPRARRRGEREIARVLASAEVRGLLADAPFC
jgi:glycosyltransferase involved in cell wall biosynthesis